ncbi:MAG: hypothetical protein NZ700_16050 [Gemmataceae bacterium]|nr:hypothetical protein [Gemmataceae bacterium]MDW8264151.1 hypothetical protein [Gemmataceae bacterium]
MRARMALLGMTFVFFLPDRVGSCSLCTGTLNTLTFRQDLAQTRLVVYGYLANPRLSPNGMGTTELHIERVLKHDPILGDRRFIELPHYVPVTDPKNPPRFLVFCDVRGDGRLDPYRGIPARSSVLLDYVRGIMKLDPNDRSAALLYFFRFLDSPDQEVSNDAFLEFAKASDADVGKVATKLSPERIRRWLQDSQTETRRLSLYAFLLGACGGEEDAAVLRSMIEKPTDRTTSCLGGVLAGYMQLRPREGWELAQQILGDPNRPFAHRLGALTALRFFQGWKPEESRRQIVRGLGALLAQGDMADLAIEDLRRFGYWELTPEVLAQYGKPSHDTPIVRRAIIRYALVCPRPEAKRFVQQVRQQDAELVKDVEESLEFEKPK